MMFPWNNENKYYSLPTELVNDNLWQPPPLPPTNNFELNKAHKYISLAKHLQPSQGASDQKKINADFFAVNNYSEAKTWILKPFWGEQALGCGSIWSIAWMCLTDLWSDSPRTPPQPEILPQDSPYMGGLSIVDLKSAE